MQRSLRHYHADNPRHSFVEIYRRGKLPAVEKRFFRKAKFPWPKKTVGMIVMARNRFISLTVFPSPKYFRNEWRRVLVSAIAAPGVIDYACKRPENRDRDEMEDRADKIFYQLFTASCEPFEPNRHQVDVPSPGHPVPSPEYEQQQSRFRIWYTAWTGSLSLDDRHRLVHLDVIADNDLVNNIHLLGH